MNFARLNPPFHWYRRYDRYDTILTIHDYFSYSRVTPTTLYAVAEEGKQNSKVE